ncbi:hypothetical protein NRB20_15900 [Nocardia sp. RB20]|uniref:Smf/DprA SLOG domain-containing protein n=2 Tax=Nocardia macrotermitis TaxID=2585198 RepID=A0A7K0CYI9_9NOCA|nr:hypothetical protein [Nocardia macrotermitis]
MSGGQPRARWASTPAEYADSTVSEEYSAAREPIDVGPTIGRESASGYGDGSGEIPGRADPMPRSADGAGVSICGGTAFGEPSGSGAVVLEEETVVGRDGCAGAGAYEESILRTGTGEEYVELDSGGYGNLCASGGFAEDGDERRLAWVYLSRVVQGPCAALSGLIERVGVVEAARAVRECDLPESLRGATEQRRGSDCAERDLASILESGGRVVTPDDPEWPAWRMLGLGQLDAARDPGAAVPLVLWVRGPGSLLTASEKALAVVGARCSTGYGERVTGEIVGDLAAQRWTIVSGAAFGIDGAAHRAALAAGAPTIAVLACGVDRPYPAAHARLLAEIAETGLVVSEYPPGATAHKHHFLARNRIIAALADGVLVVEAGLRSGARNTVKWARRLGRPALAIPGPVTSASSAGCHRMIREGEAVLVSRAEEIVDEAGPLHLSLPADAPVPERALDGDEALVYAALPRSGARIPLELSGESGLSLPAVRAALAALDLAGLVGCDESGWFRTTRRGR